MTRVAVIGVGSIEQNHARFYTEIPDAFLVGVADTNEQIATAVGDQYGVPAYFDYREMLEIEKPEAVSIVVPTALHEEVAMLALEAGAHILIQNPIAASLEEGKHIIETARRLRRLVMIGHTARFNPVIRALKQKLDAGELGRIYQIFCRRAGPFPLGIEGKGITIDLGSRDIDLIRFLIGMEPIRAYAETEQNIHADHEDLLFGMLRFPEDITAALEINWLTPTRIEEFSVLGERGLFRVDGLAQDLYFYENAHATDEIQGDMNKLKGVSEGAMTRFSIQRYDPIKAELESFLSAVNGDTKIPVTGENGLLALRLALALVEAGQTHQVINL